MVLKRTVVAVLAVTLATCSSDGAALPTETSDTTAATQSSTTGVPRSSTTSSSLQKITTVSVVPTLTDSGQSGFEDALGTSVRACVDVDQIVATEEPEMVGPEGNRQPVFAVRSGEFLAGNFASVVGNWSEWPSGEVKIYWIPFDWHVAFTEPLEVTVEPLDSNDSPVVQTFEVRASNAGGIFWPSGTKFPEPGRYRLTATAPGHWGCFELTV